MPIEELSDFEELWKDSMIDATSGDVKLPGGPTNGGVNYTPLCDWSSGNAMSIDPTTDSTARDVMACLVDNMRSSLRLLDADPNSHTFNQNAGLTGDMMTLMLGKPVRKKDRTFNPKWVVAESFLQYMVANGHAILYSNKNTLANDKVTEVVANVRAGNVPGTMQGRAMIVGTLLTARHDAHVRINNVNGWETYIRDFFGAPDGLATAAPGSLSDRVPVGTARTMPLPIHEVLALTWSRANASSTSNWSTVQYEVKKILTSEAIRNNTNRISLDRYYQVFTELKMGHMSDYCLGQVADSTSRNNFTLVDIGTAPQQWEVEFEPALLRWREYHRTRGRVI